MARCAQACSTGDPEKWLSGAGLDADCVLLIFTLAALAPEDQHIMLSNAFKVSCTDHLLLHSRFQGNTCCFCSH